MKDAVIEAALGLPFQEIEDLYTGGASDAELCDALVARQVDEGVALDAPSNSVQKHLDQWQLDNDEDAADGITPIDWMEEWRAAVERHKSIVEQVHPAFDPEVTHWNDAELTGVPCDEWVALMSRETALTFGRVGSARKRDDTRDDQWSATPMAWSTVIEGSAEKLGSFERVKQSAWGLSRHPEDQHKGGGVIVFGACVKHRRAASVVSLGAVALDCDTGHLSFDDAVERTRELGVAFFASTSFNHMTTESAVKYDAVVKHANCDGEPSLDQIKAFVAEKKGLAPHIVASIAVLKMREHGPDGLVIRLSHDPIEKFRIGFPLAHDVLISDQANTEAEAHELHRRKVLGLAEKIGIVTDVAATDVSRAFYTPRHRRGAQYRTVIHRAPPIAYADIPLATSKPKKPTKQKRERVVVSTTGGITVDVTNLYERYAQRWMLADIAEDAGLGTSANASNGAGKFHTRCAFSDGHTDCTDDTATVAWNADDTTNEFAVLKCLHASCHGRHLTEYLGAWIESGELDPALLEDADFMVPFGDGQEEQKFFRRTPDEKASVLEEAIGAGSSLDADANDDELTAFFGPLIEAGDESTIAREIVRLADDVGHPLGRRGLQRIVKNAREAIRADARQNQRGEVLNDAAGFELLVPATKEKLATANTANPFLFGYLDEPVELRRNAKGLKIKQLDYDGLSEVISRHVSFEKTDQYGSRSSAPPMDVVRNIHNQHLEDWTLPLEAIANAPFFDASGELMSDDGYHEDCGVYLDAEDLNVARVSALPSEEELQECRDLFFEALGDFPFDGMSREELADAVSPSYANMVGLIILPFMRDMIAGPTPGHLINKPKPGTGAGKLLNVAALIWTGKRATVMTVPKRREEIGKTIIAKLRSGVSYLVFDNIPDNLDSDDLAVALSEGSIDARVLGRNDGGAVDPVEVRATWVFTGNNVTMSDELLRRMTLIGLDAHTATPETRSGWLHPNLEAWVAANRGRLIWACLTLIQNWIAKGRMPFTGAVKGTFDEWLAAVGGVLNSAGIFGFYRNVNDLREVAADSSDAALTVLASVFSDYLPGTEFYVGGDSANTIMSILNNGPDGSAISIPGWGYSAEDGGYTNASQVGRHFKKFARTPHVGRRAVEGGFLEIEIGFEEDYDSHRKSNFYRLKMRRVGDIAWITSINDPAWEAILAGDECGAGD